MTNIIKEFASYAIDLWHHEVSQFFDAHELIRQQMMQGLPKYSLSE